MSESSHITFKDRVVEYVNSQEFFDSFKKCITHPSPDTDKALKALSWAASMVTPKLSSTDPDLQLGGDVVINIMKDSATSD